MQVSERKRRGNPALRAMAAKPPDISEYLRSQGFGPRELATLEAADSAAIAGQLAFELNIPHSEELAKAVVPWSAPLCRSTACYTHWRSPGQ